MNKLINLLIIALAVIAAIVAVGIIDGHTMQPFIVAYWIVLTEKNLLDFIKANWKEVKSENAPILPDKEQEQ